MRQTRNHLPTDAVYPFRGMDVTTPSTVIPAQFSPKCKNVVVEYGEIKKRKGGDALDVSDLVGEIVGFVDFSNESGTKQHFIVTTKHQYLISSGRVISEAYHYNFTGDLWTILAAGGSVVYDTGFNLVTIPEAFATGDLCVRTDPGTVDITAANGIAFDIKPSIAFAAGELTLTLAITGADVALNLPAIDAGVWTRVYLPADLSTAEDVSLMTFALTANKGAFTFEFGDVYAVCLWSTGTENDLAVFDSGFDEDGKYVFITNGVDRIIYWDGTKMSLFQPGGDLEGITACKGLAIYYGALVVAGICISSTWETKAVAMSVPGKFFDFSGVGSDYRLVDYIKDDIKQVLVLGVSLIIYASDSYVICNLVGGDVIYSFSELFKIGRAHV